MKSLQESLFDKDIESKDVKLGELYELGDKNGDCMFTNNPLKFMDIFNKKAKSKKIEFVDMNNHFLDMYELGGIGQPATRLEGLSSIIDTILCAPAQDFMNPNNVPCEKALKEYLKPYIVDSRSYYDLYIGIRRFKVGPDPNAWIEITIWDDIRARYSNSLKILLKKK